MERLRTEYDIHAIAEARRKNFEEDAGSVLAIVCVCVACSGRGVGAIDVRHNTSRESVLLRILKDCFQRRAILLATNYI